MQVRVNRKSWKLEGPIFRDILEKISATYLAGAPEAARAKGKHLFSVNENANSRKTFLENWFKKLQSAGTLVFGHRKACTDAVLSTCRS